MAENAAVIVAIPAAIKATIESIQLVAAMCSVEPDQAHEFPFGDVAMEKRFYMISKSGRYCLGCDTSMDGDGDPIFTPVEITCKDDLTNMGVQFVFKDNLLYCMCGNFKRSTRCHALGVAADSCYTFAAWDAELHHRKYKWHIAGVDGRVVFHSVHIPHGSGDHSGANQAGLRFLSADGPKTWRTRDGVGQRYKNRIYVSTEEDAYEAVFLNK